MEDDDKEDARRGGCTKGNISAYYEAHTDLVHRILGTAIILVIGFGIGLSTPVPSDLQESSCGLTCGLISNVLGWTYFAAWSLSFYPQLILNYQRKSVVGMSFDYQVYNVIGFTCYSVYNANLYWNPVVQQEYQDQSGGANNQVQLADVFFPIHGALITYFIVYQIKIYERGTQTVSLFCLVASSVFVFGIVYYLVMAIIFHDDDSLFNWLAFVNFLSYIKLAITCIKYFPQCYLNFKRKSTVGCNIDNFILDFVGGSLSVTQLVMDAMLTSDWSAVTGVIAKFILGSLSMVFDCIFFFQHYVLYTDRTDKDRGLRYAPLPVNDH